MVAYRCRYNESKVGTPAATTNGCQVDSLTLLATFALPVRVLKQGNCFLNKMNLNTSTLHITYFYCLTHVLEISYSLQKPAIGSSLQLLTYLNTPWCTILFEKIVTQITKKYPA